MIPSGKRPQSTVKPKDSSEIAAALLEIVVATLSSTDSVTSSTLKETNGLEELFVSQS
jgi:hypothetical protein